MNDVLRLFLPGGIGTFLLSAAGKVPDWLMLLSIPTILMATLGGVGLLVDFVLEPPNERVKWRDVGGAIGFCLGLVGYLFALVS